MTKQRVRVTFAKGAPLHYISHLDLALAWERALRRAGVPLAYSQGHNPQARLQLASGLPLGYTSSAEMMDVYLVEPMPPEEFAARLGAVLPAGLRIIAVEEVPMAAASLQAALRQASYRVQVETRLPAGELAQRIARLLAAEHLEQQRTRKGRREDFDLRGLVEDVALVCVDAQSGQAVLSMCLSAGPQGNVRPDAVLEALGLEYPYAQVERTQLVFETTPDAGVCPRF